MKKKIFVMQCIGRAVPPSTGMAPPLYIGLYGRFVWHVEQALQFESKEICESEIKKLRLTHFKPAEFEVET